MKETKYTAANESITAKVTAFRKSIRGPIPVRAVTTEIRKLFFVQWIFLNFNRIKILADL